MRIARRIALLSWALATFVALGFIIETEVSIRLAEAIYGAAPLITAFLALLPLRGSRRRWFYGGMSLAAAAGAFAVYGIGVLEDRTVTADGHDLWTAAFEDYMDREFPGWEYDDEAWPRWYGSAPASQPGRYRHALAVLGVEHKGSEYWVFGNCHEKGREGGWCEPTFLLYPLSEDREMIPEEKLVVAWPRTVKAEYP